MEASSLAGSVVRIAITSLVFFSLYIGAVIFLHRGPEPIYQIARLLPDVVPWRFSRLPSPREMTPARRKSPQEDSLPVA